MTQATLYTYDFTRLPSAWSSRIPDAPVLQANCSTWWGWQEAYGVAHPGRSADGAVTAGRACSHWWARTRVREYVPVVTKELLGQQVTDHLPILLPTLPFRISHCVAFSISYRYA